MNRKNYFITLCIVFLAFLCQKKKKIVTENLYRKWHWDPGFWFYSFTLILLEKIAGGDNLQTVFLCWWHNKHQNQVSFTTWNPKKNSVLCVLVKKRKYLLFGQKSPELHNIICGLILKTGKWLQVLIFSPKYVPSWQGFDVIDRNRAFIQRPCIIFIPSLTYFWVGTILPLTLDENSGWENKILIV